MNLIAGIDPGLDGAIALLDADNRVAQLIDMPTLNVKVMATIRGKRREVTRRRHDIYKLARWFDLYGADISDAFVEDPQSMPDDGGIQAFRFGFGCGVVQMAVASQFIKPHLVKPGVWKRRMGLTADKDGSRRLASQRFPLDGGLWPLKKHDGRAEAALLALYGKGLRDG